MIKIKKTTIYIEEKDHDTLKTAAFITNTTVAELIRKSIKDFCNKLTEEKKVIEEINKVKEEKEKYSFTEISTLVDEAKKEVTTEKKSKSKSKKEKPLENIEKTARIELHLRVENNSKFVRGKTKTRKNIEDHLEYYYNMEKPDPNGIEYIIYVKYNTTEELEEKVYDLFAELERKADLRNGFVEPSAWCEELDLSW